MDGTSSMVVHSLHAIEEGAEPTVATRGTLTDLPTASGCLRGAFLVAPPPNSQLQPRAWSEQKAHMAPRKLA
jgi:hypothetical protein